MASYPSLFLKVGSDVHLQNRHHAIFKSAIGRVPAAEDGDIVEVKSSTGEFLCYATYNSKAYICGRAISFEQRDPLVSLKEAMRDSIELRAKFLKDEDTTACRLINAEGDGIPGLIIDRYGDVLVVQCTTLGMDRLREWVADTLMELTGLTLVFEKSTSSARAKEGLEPREGWLRGSGSTSIPVRERGVKFLIELQGSQKTGLFIDQREMRSLVRTLSKDKTVLDCCSYVGGFSVSALMGGAKGADAVDYDPQAIVRAKQHVEMNGIDPKKFGAHAEDVFTFLRRRPYPRNYDFIVLDPPAFAKRSSDIEQAKKAYTDLNRLAMQMLPKGGLLLTCSCSYHVDMQMFQTIVFHAARQAKRGARILQRHRQAFDHPVNLYHPEVDYLKSLLLYVE
jgi:23S rRNA (cytosine1962-C5)-methyltransferase